MVFCPGNIAPAATRSPVSEGTWGVKEQEEESSPTVTMVLTGGPMALSQTPEGQGTGRGPERTASEPSTALSAGGIAASRRECPSEAPELGTEASNPQEVDRTRPVGAQQGAGEGTPSGREGGNHSIQGPRKSGDSGLHTGSRATAEVRVCQAVG